jgi:hypothetical protein
VVDQTRPRLGKAPILRRYATTERAHTSPQISSVQKLIEYSQRGLLNGALLARHTDAGCSLRSSHPEEQAWLYRSRDFVIGLGIGANIAIFSLVDAVVLKYLPVERPGELIQLQYRAPDWSSASTTFSNPVWEQVRDHQDVFAAAFAWSNKDQLDLTQGGMMRPANGLWVSGRFFSALGLHAAVGRLISDSDDRRGCPAVAVLSYGFWQDHFGGAKSAIGRTLSLRRRAFEVIGIAPRGFFRHGSR